MGLRGRHQKCLLTSSSKCLPLALAPGPGGIAGKIQNQAKWVALPCQPHLGCLHSGLGVNLRATSPVAPPRGTSCCTAMPSICPSGTPGPIGHPSSPLPQPSSLPHRGPSDQDQAKASQQVPGRKHSSHEPWVPTIRSPLKSQRGLPRSEVPATSLRVPRGAAFPD